jgi:hypothetical protein
LEKNPASITCKCGKIIPIIQDVAVLGRVIEEHIEEHKKEAVSKKKQKEETDVLHDNLLQQVFDIADEASKKIV